MANDITWFDIVSLFFDKAEELYKNHKYIKVFEKKFKEKIDFTDGKIVTDFTSELTHLFSPENQKKIKELVKDTSTFDIEQTLEDFFSKELTKINKQSDFTYMLEEHVKAYTSLVMEEIKKNSPEEYQYIISGNIKRAVDKGFINMDVRFDKVIENDNRNTKKILYAMNSSSENQSTPMPYNLLKANFSIGIENLIGRTNDIKKINTHLQSNRPMVLIHGMGGVGKSELCRKISEAHDCNKLAWFNFSISIRDTIKILIGKEVPPEQMEAEIDKAKQFLISLNKDYLLVFDNAEKLNKNECDFIRSLKCKVLITTREKYDGLDDIAHLYPLKLLSKQACMELFDHHAKKDHTKDLEKDLEEIITRTGRHTLAIELLGKIIKSNFGPSTISELLEELKEKNFALDDVIKRNADTEDKEFINHMISLFDISKVSDDEKKIHLLKNLCILPSLPVHHKNLTKWIGQEYKITLKELSDLGWLESKSGEFTMHAVISKTLQHKLTPAYEDCQTLVASLAEEIHYEYEIERYNPPHFTLCLALAEYFDNKEIEEKYLAFLFHNIGYIYQDLGKYNIALRYLIKTSDIQEKIYGNHHISTAVTYNNIGEAYRKMNEYSKALNYYKKALATKHKYSIIEHTDISATYNNIGIVYQAKGDYKKVLRYCNKALATKHKYSIIKHTNISAIYNNMGIVYQAKRDYKKALRYCNKALAMRKKVLGNDHPHTASSYNNIASIYQDMGNYEKSLHYYKKDISISERVLEKNHPDTATTYNNMAVLYAIMEDYEQSLDMISKASYIYLTVLGQNHTYTKSSYISLQMIYAVSSKPIDGFDKWLDNRFDEISKEK